MKNIFTVLLVVVLSFFATNAFAGNVYFSGSGGLTILQDSDVDVSGELPGSGTLSFDKGWNVGGALGYDFGSFRTEFEITHRNNGFDEVSGVDFTALSYLINGYFDLENKSAFTPYVGVGLGMANIKIIVSGENVNDNVFAYKLTAGMAYDVTPNFSFTTDYSFFGTSDSTFKGPGIALDMEYHSHNINAGIRYSF